MYMTDRLRRSGIRFHIDGNLRSKVKNYEFTYVFTIHASATSSLLSWCVSSSEEVYILLILLCC